MMALMGCQPEKPLPNLRQNEKIDFSVYYREKPVQKIHAKKRAAGDFRRMTFDIKGMPLQSFLSLLAVQSGVSIVADKELQAERITMTVDDLDIEQIVESVARQLNTSHSRKGKVFYLGSFRETDNSFMVGFCPRMNKTDMQSALSSFVSDKGKLFTQSDGLFVVSDNDKVLTTLAQFLETLSNARADSWLVQYQFVVFRAQDTKDMRLSADANFNLSLASAGDSADSAHIQAAVSRAIEQGNALLLAQPMMILENGATAKITDGEQVPIPRKSVSSEGTVTTTGVDYRDTGTSVESTVLDLGNGSLRLQSLISLNTITGYNGDYPVVKGQNLQFTASIESNRAYLIASLNQSYVSYNRGSDNTVAFVLDYVRPRSSGESAGALTSALKLSKKRSHEKTDYLLQIWARAYRIADYVGGGVSADAAPSAPVEQPPLILQQSFEDNETHKESEQVLTAPQGADLEQPENQSAPDSDAGIEFPMPPTEIDIPGEKLELPPLVDGPEI